MKSIQLFFFLFGLSLLTAWGVAPVKGADGNDATFEGRIYDSASGAGIADLTVRLIPPKGAKPPVKITTSDEKGRFRFKKLQNGKYQLEVKQGVRLLYRKEIHTDDKKINIALRTRKQGNW